MSWKQELQELRAAYFGDDEWRDGVEALVDEGGRHPPSFQRARGGDRRPLANAAELLRQVAFIEGLAVAEAEQGG